MSALPNLKKSASFSVGPFKGILEKKGRYAGFLKTKKYSCSIEEGKLCYQRDGDNSKTPGSIDLSRTQTIRPGRGFTIEIVTSSRTHTFIAPSNEQQEKWIKNLQEAMRQSSRKFSTASWMPADSESEDDCPNTNGKLQHSSSMLVTKTSQPVLNLDKLHQSTIGIQAETGSSCASPQTLTILSAKNKELDDTASTEAQKLDKDCSNSPRIGSHILDNHYHISQLISQPIAEHVNEDECKELTGDPNFRNASDETPKVEADSTEEVSKFEETNSKEDGPKITALSPDQSRSLSEVQQTNTIISTVEIPKLDGTVDQVSGITSPIPVKPVPEVVRRRSNIPYTVPAPQPSEYSNSESVISSQVPEVIRRSKIRSRVETPHFIEATSEDQILETSKLATHNSNEGKVSTMILSHSMSSSFSNQTKDSKNSEKNGMPEIMLELEIDTRADPIPSLPHALKEGSETSAFNKMKEFIVNNDGNFVIHFTDSSDYSNGCGLAVKELKSLLKNLTSEC